MARDGVLEAFVMSVTIATTQREWGWRVTCRSVPPLIGTVSLAAKVNCKKRKKPDLAGDPTFLFHPPPKLTTGRVSCSGTDLIQFSQLAQALGLGCFWHGVRLGGRSCFDLPATAATIATAAATMATAAIATAAIAATTATIEQATAVMTGTATAIAGTAARTVARTTTATIEQSTTATAMAAEQSTTATPTKTAATIATAATMATRAGNNFLFTVHEGQSYDREKHRDAKHQCSIHFQNPPTYRYRK